MSTRSIVHVYQPPTSGSERTLLPLHGTGGDERDLLPLARRLDPRAGVLSPRGQVLERGMPRFFRRLSEGVFDLDDLRQRTHALADFVAAAAATYRFDPSHVTAVGFSNGANIASSMLLLRPEALDAAVLLRGMVPFIPDQPLRLPQTPVLISNGRHDPMVAAAQTEQLAAILESAGASVTLAWQNAGHELTEQDLVDAAAWLAADHSSRRTTTPSV